MENKSTPRDSLTVIILTKNEEQHIERAIRSAKEVTNNILVVDSGSNDQTIAISQQNGAKILEHQWINHATQFNWALTQLPEDTVWVMRLDADEVIQPDLREQITNRLQDISEEVKGIYVNRSVKFLGDPVTKGGLFPIKVLRIFRHGEAHCENRWMDEHIVCDGATTRFSGNIIDDNLNNLTWWIDKHNSYASREVVDIILSETNSEEQETIGRLNTEQASLKRWIKENIYYFAPNGARAFLYFIYRYIVFLGFLDTPGGRKFHILQGFWYRYLVDAKLIEVKKLMRNKNLSRHEAIFKALGIRINH